MMSKVNRVIIEQMEADLAQERKDLEDVTAAAPWRSKKSRPGAVAAEIPFLASGRRKMRTRHARKKWKHCLDPWNQHKTLVRATDVRYSGHDWPVHDPASALGTADHCVCLCHDCAARLDLKGLGESTRGPSSVEGGQMNSLIIIIGQAFIVSVATVVVALRGDMR